MTFRTRFAPSPTGPLHLGHAYSAMLAHDMAMENGGDFLLRIEDIDQTRSRPEWEDQIYEDLAWLGLSWETPVLRQSDRVDTYRAALQRLWENDWLYPCRCNRKDILAAAAAPNEGTPLVGPDGIVYPGTCRSTHDPSGLPNSLTEMPTATALRLNMAMAAALATEHRIDDPDRPWSAFGGFTETGAGPDGETGLIEFTEGSLIDTIGDVVLSRRDFVGSYHLSVVLDDADQQITHVIRGNDLFEATKIHVVLQRLLGLPTPIYHHHQLIRDEAGKRLAKRDDARAISKFREEGHTPEDIRRMVGLISQAP